MTSSNTDDVLVAGAGVIGLFCALELLRAGRQVVVVDRVGPGAGASHGNCGTLTPSHAPPLAAPGTIGKAMGWLFKPDAPLLIRPRLDPALLRWLWGFSRRCRHAEHDAATRVRSQLLNTSMQLLQQQIVAEGLECEFVRSGLVYAFLDEGELAREAAAVAELREFGIEAELLGKRKLLEMEPALRPDAVVGGISFPGDSCLRPDLLVSELVRCVLALGGRIENGVEINRIRHDRDGVTLLTLDGQQRRARDVVFALGAWSPLLLRDLRLKLPMQPGKGYSLTMSRPTLAPRQPLVLKERSVCVTTWERGYRLGSTMEFAGYDSSLNPVRLEALRRAAREYLIEPEGETTLEQWYGWRPMMVDDVPVIGAVPRVPGAWVATGHGMLGVSMSAVTARLVGDLIMAREPIIDPQGVTPQRFH